MIIVKVERSISQWLRAIADCGIIRVAFDCDPLVEAWELGLVSSSTVADSEDALDFRLTAAGIAAVEAANGTA